MISFNLIFFCIIYFQKKEKRQNARRVLRRSASLRRSATGPVNKYSAWTGGRGGAWYSSFESAWNFTQSGRIKKFWSDLPSVATVVVFCLILIFLNVENLQNLRNRAFSSSEYKSAKIVKSKIERKWKSESPKQIYFCKTHKTGGSTLQNIIFRNFFDKKF